jgi:hypothetical protein
MKVIRLKENDIQRMVKRVLTEQEEKENIITSIQLGGEIVDDTDKVNASVIGALGCKNCEDPNGSYNVGRVSYDKSKMEDAIGDTTKILVFDKNKKVVHTEPHPKSKGFVINFKIPKDKLEAGDYFVVASKDNKTLSYQPVNYEPLFGDDLGFDKDKDDFFKDF